ncbi:serine/threonine-protein kinase [Planktothricoides raciborskii]|uniref:Serine/threonine-protein kinase n=3 Tax=Planktothricoides TaxID=132607 RepID=A0AAU8JEK3_9CYAN|nr:serine/threonine-protein kinase [Planktothricoides raciborskii]MBD2544930.1 serine/threonine protein kinase [Planktothricoides raciborskii FACHB-1370]MBD2582977.1 serine/threonine protein kinase [Planktothricoides raciborskii FACHB-1261]
MSYCINPNCPKPSDPLNANNRICRQCGTELLIAGRYRVTKLLGEGGFAKTYEVDDRGFAKVLKVLQLKEPKAIALFKQEANVLQKLRHPGIPRVEPQGYFTVKMRASKMSIHCLVMQKIYGQNLEEWLGDRGNYPITQEEAIDWLKQMTDILQEVHRWQFFHRDIKPTNIMLQPNGQLALIDFGSVREVTGTYLAKMGVGHRGTVIASKGYAPPEQENGHPVPQSDFFALGRTFVHLLTGKHPLEFYDPCTDTLQWRNSAPKISPFLADFIDYLISRLPGNRPQNTHVILQQLTEIEKNITVKNNFLFYYPLLYQGLPKAKPWKKPNLKSKKLAVATVLLIGIVGYLEVNIYKYIRANLTENNSTESPLSTSPLPHKNDNKFETIQPPQMPEKSLTDNREVSPVKTAPLARAMLNVTAAISPQKPGSESNKKPAIAKSIASAITPNLSDKNISLYKTLSGHDQDVQSVAITPDGTEIASGSFDGTIKIWNLKTGELMQTLTGHSDAGEIVSSIAISPDGKILVSSTNSYGGNIKIWDLSSGLLLATLNAQQVGVSVVAISPDSQFLASGGYDGTIQLWNLALGEEIGTFSGHLGRVFSVAFSPNGQVLASGAEDGSVHLWNLNQIQGKVGFNLQPDRRLLGHIGIVHSVVFSPDSQRLASGSADKTIKLWQVETGEAIATLASHSGSMLSVAISPNGQILAGGSLLGRIKLWNLDTGEVIDTLSAHSRWVESVVFSPDGHILASGSSDRTVKIWDLEKSPR